MLNYMTRHFDLNTFLDNFLGKKLSQTRYTYRLYCFKARKAVK